MFSTSYEPTTNSKVVLQKLADENYFKWSYEMEMHLRSLGLWKNVCFETIEEYLKSLDGEEEPQEIKLEPKKKAKSNESPLKLIEAMAEACREKKMERR
jgi:copper chaperone CopZ